MNFSISPLGIFLRVFKGGGMVPRTTPAVNIHTNRQFFRSIPSSYNATHPPLITVYWITSNRWDCVLLVCLSCLCILFYFITVV